MSLSGVYADFFERYFPNLREYESNCRPALEAICAAREPLERRWNLRSGGLRTFPTKVTSNASALPDARSRWGVNGGEELLARPVKSFGGGRPGLRRTRALCKFNCGKRRF